MAISINDAVMEVFKRPKRLQDELNVANERLKHVAQVCTQPIDVQTRLTHWYIEFFDGMESHSFLRNSKQTRNKGT